VQFENTPAQLTDRDGAPDLLRAIRSGIHGCATFADGGYSGDKLKDAMAGTAAGPSRSSSAQTRPRASSPCLAAGRGADIRMAGTLPPPREGPGEIHPKRHRLRTHRQHPQAHGTHRKTLQTRVNL